MSYGSAALVVTLGHVGVVGRLVIFTERGNHLGLLGILASLGEIAARSGTNITLTIVCLTLETYLHGLKSMSAEVAKILENAVEKTHFIFWLLISKWLDKPILHLSFQTHLNYFCTIPKTIISVIAQFANEI